eukprot:4532227-Pyramimonas_sp.AAC.1
MPGEFPPMWGEFPSMPGESPPMPGEFPTMPLLSLRVTHFRASAAAAFAGVWFASPRDGEVERRRAELVKMFLQVRRLSNTWVLRLHPPGCDLYATHPPQGVAFVRRAPLKA